MWIFDRHQPKHRWARAFSDLRDSKFLPNQAVGQNWQMDHRVTEAREEEMLRDCPCDHEPDGAAWKHGIESYFNEQLCCPWHDHPAARPANAKNHSPERVAAHDLLLHAASLNRTLGHLAQQLPSYDFRETFENLTGDLFPDRQGSPVYRPPFSNRVDAIVASLQQKGPDTLRALAAALLDELGDTEPLWWASFAEELSDLVAAGDGGGLCKALGLGHIYEGEWLLLWRYQVAVAGPLLRPTVIEANTSPFHHPSPPISPWGITMPLTAHLPLCREVQHPPLRGAIAASACTGVLYRVERHPEVYNELPELRRSHRARLATDIPDATTEEWIRRHESQ